MKERIKVLNRSWVEVDDDTLTRLKEKSIDAQCALGIDTDKPLIIEMESEFKLLHEVDLIRDYYLLKTGEDLY